MSVATSPVLPRATCVIEMADCTRVVFTLSAVVPAQDFDLIDTGIRIDAGPEARDEPAPDTSVRAIFEAELTHFDFGSLP